MSLRTYEPMSHCLRVELILILLLLIFIKPISSSAQSFDLYPLCSMNGDVTCPDGFTAACEDEEGVKTEPKCIFYGTRYVPGCWKFIGKKSIDFSLLPNFSTTTMVTITGGGDVHTLNREIVGCEKL